MPRFKRRDYQKLITDFILEKPRCNIYATMGAGKTSSVMWSLDRMLRTGILEDWNGRTGDRVLILAPLRVASGTWPAEQMKWGFPHLRVGHATGFPCAQAATGASKAPTTSAAAAAAAKNGMVSPS